MLKTDLIHSSSIASFSTFAILNVLLHSLKIPPTTRRAPYIRKPKILNFTRYSKEIYFDFTLSQIEKLLNKFISPSECTEYRSFLNESTLSINLLKLIMKIRVRAVLIDESSRGD